MLGLTRKFAYDNIEIHCIVIFILSYRSKRRPLPKLKLQDLENGVTRACQNQLHFIAVGLSGT